MNEIAMICMKVQTYVVVVFGCFKYLIITSFRGDVALVEIDGPVVKLELQGIFIDAVMR